MKGSIMLKNVLTSEIKDWNNVDYVCIKAKQGNLSESVYYLDGHPIMESSFTESDKDFIRFTRSINSYGVSEKMLSNTSSDDRFYVRVNISSEQQELKLVDYLSQGDCLSPNQKQILDHLRNMCSVTKETNDYRSLYFCGFSKEHKLDNYSSIRFYFKTFSISESPHNMADYIDYCEQCPVIKEDPTFQIIRNLVVAKCVRLRCIGIDLSDCCSVKIKYYLYVACGDDSISKLLLKLKKYPQYTQNADSLLKVVPAMYAKHLYCELLQISAGFSNEDANISVYLKAPTEYKKIYYSMREGLVLRDIGGISFLIDTHEKHYYDLKELLSVNETGQAIIKYLMIAGVSTLGGIVSYIRSLIKDNDKELYSVIYSDCETFVDLLQTNGYLLEVM